MTRTPASKTRKRRVVPETIIKYTHTPDDENLESGGVVLRNRIEYGHGWTSLRDKTNMKGHAGACWCVFHGIISYKRRRGVNATLLCSADDNE